MTTLTLAVAAAFAPFAMTEVMPEQAEIAAVAPDSTSDTTSRPASAEGVERTDVRSEYELQTIETDKGVYYKAGPVRTDEVLPEGYVRPTAPGAIEIKHYPSVRRAEIAGDGERDYGMWAQNTGRAFWPLFRHIQSRDIPMTAPVEFDYHGMSDADDRDGWAMSFLYRTPDEGETGKDGDIVVYDTEPVTVVAFGVRSDLMPEELAESVATLESWIERSGEWAVAGSPRTLGYNGPNIGRDNRWWEVQIPVERVDPQPNEDDAP